MIPAPFTHVRVTSAKEASEALNHYGDEAKLLAGGHSLIPLMKLRLATPSVLIDIMRIPDLKGIRRDGGNIIIGALTHHVDIERSPIVQQYAPRRFGIGLVRRPACSRRNVRRQWPFWHASYSSL
jgi:aerobic carbon-monoxide dehydrogenase medium subunit